MRKIVNYTILLFYFFVFSSCISKTESLQNLSGTWEIEDEKGSVIKEKWESVSETHWVGYGCTLFKDDTIFKERMEIISLDSGWYYVAHPGFALHPTYFKIEGVEDTGFVAKNPKHDFPNCIEYTWKKDSLLITIQGNPNFEQEEIQYIKLKRTSY